MKKVVLAGIVAGISLAGSAVAQPYYGYGPGGAGPGAYYPGAPAQPPRGGYGYRGQPQVEQGENAAAVLKQGMDNLLSFLRQSPDPAQLAAFLEAEVAPAFDFTYMARAAAGPRPTA